MADDHTLPEKWVPTTDEVRRGHHSVEGFDRWLAAHDAAVSAQALRDAADQWQTGGWSDDLPTTGNPILGMAQRATNWIRARADQLERTGGA